VSRPGPDEVRAVSRRLRARADGMLAEAWFMPEAQVGFTELGVGAAATMFGGRIGPLGAIPGAAAAALLVPVRPESVASAVDEAWSATTPDALLETRERACTGYVRAIIRSVDGPDTDGVDRAAELARRAADAGPVAGHPLAAAHRARGWTGDSIVDLWRACERIRERRHESHRNAWTAAGLDPCELCVVTDLWRGPLISSVSGSWSADEQAAARDRLGSRGLTADDGLTVAGHALREAIEEATDAQESDVVAALGADADELLARLAPWSTAVVEWAGRQLAG
jgi:hypothetical protein